MPSKFGTAILLILSIAASSAVAQSKHKIVVGTHMDSQTLRGRMLIVYADSNTPVETISLVEPAINNAILLREKLMRLVWNKIQLIKEHKFLRALKQNLANMNQGADDLEAEVCQNDDSWKPKSSVSCQKSIV